MSQYGITRFRTGLRRLKRLAPSRARSAYICSRLLYASMPTQARSRIVARLGRSWPSFCPVCEEPVAAFSPLADFYFDELKASGSDLHPSDFETCNFPAYHCPHCGASDRERLYALYLGGRLPATEAEQKDFRLLDIAPAQALSNHIRRKYRTRYRTADLLMRNVDDRVDVTDMHCYEDNRFDALICSHVLEHVSDDRKAMTELRRILRPGGWGIVMVPICVGLEGIREDPAVTAEPYRWKHFGQGDHVRLYSRAGFVRRLQEAGLIVHQFGRDDFGADRLRRCGICERSVLYVVERPDVR